MTEPAIDDDFSEIADLDVHRLDAVKGAANGLRFLVAKSAGTPPAVLASTVDGQEATVTDTLTADVVKADEPALADPDPNAAGDPADPGSPAWESIDAETAREVTADLAQARVVVDILADREATESMVDDPGDADNVFDLDDASCAIDYAISLVAPYAVGEQVEAEMGDALSVVKAVHGADLACLRVITGLVPVAKAGRVLSAANEGLIRDASVNLQKVLAALPTAPAAPDEPVAKTEGTPAVTEPTPTATDPATTSAPAPVDDVAKAASDPQQAVFDQNGKLIGTVDPTKITPLVGTDDKDEPADEPAPDVPPADLEPAPANAVGTPAADIAKSDPEPVADVVKADVVKAMIDEKVKAALDEQSTANAVVVKALEDRLEALEAPAPSRVLTNGALPPRHLLRGLTDGAGTDVVKSEELRELLDTTVDVTAREAIAKQMNAQAIEALAEIRANPQRG